jgi:hypothetical protein
MLKKIVFSLFVLLFSTHLFGYYAFNQRNHSEIKWKSIKSEHVEVVYHDPLFDAAVEALNISEATYTSLVKTYDTELNEKIQIFITDQDKITNGYSAAGKYIAIWVNVNNYVNIFTGREKWMRKVLSHEISHHFVFHSVKSWIDFFFPVTAISFPSDFNEGYAMFFSGEEWGYGREDASLRKGVFSNDISYQHPDGFFYTTGFSMVRYLYEFYGLEKLQELLKYRNKLKIYSFKTAFQKVYHKSLAEFKEEWRRYIYSYYYGTAYEMKSLNHDTSDFNSVNNIDRVAIKGWKDFQSAVMQDSLIFFLGKGSKNQLYYDLAYGYFHPDTLNLDTLEIRKIEKIESVSGARDLTVSENLRFCAYVKYQRGQHGSIQPYIYRYDIEKKEKEKLTDGQLVQADNSGGIYFQRMDNVNNLVKYYKDGQEKNVIKMDKKAAIGQILLSPDEKKIALTLFDEESRFLLRIYSTQDWRLEIEEELATFPRKVFWQNSDQLIFTMPLEKESRTTIRKYNIAEGGWQEYFTPPYNVVAHAIEETDTTHRALVFAQLSRKKNTLAKIDLRKVVDENYQPNLNYYSRWIHAQYPNEIIVPDTIPAITQEKYSHIRNMDSYMNLLWPDTESLLLMTFWMDPLMKHSLILAGILEYDGLKPYYIVNYVNRCFFPTLSLDYLKYVWVGGIHNDKWYLHDIEQLGVNLSFPLDIFDNPFMGLNFVTGLSYQEVALQDKDEEIDPFFDDGSAITSETALQYYYNLPFKNSYVHPVRKFKMTYQLSMSNSSLGMKQDFAEQEIDMEFSVAPLYDFFSMKIDNFLLTNKTNYNWINGRYFSQYHPGIDMNDNIPIGDGLITERHYLRGIETTLSGEKLFITKNEFWMKVSDDMKLSVKLGAPLLELKYLGLGLWTDYGKIWIGDKNMDFQTAGYEIKGLVNVLGISTIQRFGRAYNLDTENLNYYYQMNIPMP